ncbi:hypothetical protein GCK32_019990, partial [Trichostrongylus colubriformis]
MNTACQQIEFVSITTLMSSLRRNQKPHPLLIEHSMSLQKERFQRVKLGYRIRLFNVFIKTLSCVLYCVRVVNDAKLLPASHHYKDGEIKYEYLFWVGRNTFLWFIQTFVAVVSLTETIIVFYISYE